MISKLHACSLNKQMAVHMKKDVVIKQFRPILFVQEYTCMYILLLMLIVHNG